MKSFKLKTGREPVTKQIKSLPASTDGKRVQVSFDKKGVLSSPSEALQGQRKATVTLVFKTSSPVPVPLSPHLQRTAVALCSLLSAGPP